MTFWYFIGLLLVFIFALWRASTRTEDDFEPPEGLAIIALAYAAAWPVTLPITVLAKFGGRAIEQMRSR